MRMRYSAYLCGIVMWSVVTMDLPALFLLMEHTKQKQAGYTSNT